MDEERQSEIGKQYVREVIQYVHRFAEERGFSKITVEIVNSTQRDQDLIQIFQEEKFFKSGRQENKYNVRDEIVYLTSIVDTIFSIDPYDNLNASKWIVERFFNAIDISIEVRNLDIDGKAVRCQCLKFYVNTYYREANVQKLNLPIYVIVVEEFLRVNSSISKISSSDIQKLGLIGNVFVFDFTTGHSIIQQSKAYTVLSRIELNQLLPFSENRNFNFCYNRVNHEEIGGLLLVSNSEYFPAESVIRAGNKMLRNVYIKLGKYGEKLQPNQKIFYAYYDKAIPEKFVIWGYSDIKANPTLVDINKVRAQTFEVDAPIPSDGEILFDNIVQNNMFAGFKVLPIWERLEFEQHNSFNPSNIVLYFILKNYIKLSKTEHIDLRDICTDIDVHNVFDFYLSKNEVAKINRKLKRVRPEEDDNRPTRVPTVVICTAIEGEYSVVEKMLKDVKTKNNKVKYTNGILSFQDKAIARVFIVLCGQGNDNAALKTMEAYDSILPTPKCMLFVGIAGSLYKARFGDVVFATKVSSCQKSTNGRKILTMPHSDYPSAKLKDLAFQESNRPEWKTGTNNDVKVLNCPVFSTDTTLNDKQCDEAKMIFENFHDCDAVEKEGAGFMKAVKLLSERNRDLEFGVVRGISDVVPESQDDKNLDARPSDAVKTASENAASFAFWLIYKLFSDK